MANLLLAYGNKADTATISGGKWNSALPLANLKDSRLGMVTRSYNARKASTQFRCAFAANYTVRALAIVNHNLSGSAKWRVRAGRAALDILFDSDAIDDRITFAGGTNGTFVNKNGLIAPITTRTNLIIRSNEFDNVGAWPKTGTLMVTANTDYAPTGALEMDTVSNSSMGAYVSQVFTTTASTTHAFSIYIKRETSSYSKFALCDSTLANLLADITISWTTPGVPSIYASAGTWVSAPTLEPWGGGVYRLTNGVFSSGAYTSCAVVVYPGGVWTGAIRCWGIQVELGNLTTDYIPTTTAAVTVNEPRIDYDQRNRVTNLLLWSQNIAGGTWGLRAGLGAITATGGYAAAPDGSMTATLLTKTSTANVDTTWQQVIANEVGTRYTGSVWLQKTDASNIVEIVVRAGFTLVSGDVYADVDTRTGLFALAFGTLGNVTVVSDGGYWKVTVVQTQVSSGAFVDTVFGIRPTVGTVLGAYDATATGSCVVWGAQMARSPVAAYVATTNAAASAYQDFGAIRTNLLFMSQNGDAWNPNGDSGATFDVAVAPDGTQTADRAIQGGTRYTSASTKTGGVYTFSIYLKPDTGNVWVMYVDGGAGVCGYATYTFSTGLFSSPGGANVLATKAEPAPNGYTRLALTTIALSASVNIHAYPAIGGAIYYWGAQIEEGYVATDYIRTFQSPNTSPEGCRGLLIEESRTNLLLRSQNFAHATWAKANCTVTAGAIQGPDGAATGDLVTITATATATFTQNVTATATSAHAFSIYAKRGSGSSTFNYGVYNNTTSANVAFVNYNWVTGVCVLSGSGTPVATVTPVADGWIRFIVTSASAITVGNSITVYAGATGAPMTAGDSWYVFGAQLEAASFATSYIQTTATPVTRAADAAAITGANFTGFITQGAGTIYAEAGFTSTLVAATAEGFVSISDGSSSNHVSIYGLNPLCGDIALGGVPQVVGRLSATPNNWRVALAYSQNDVRFVGSGAVDSDALATIPQNLNALYIGTVFGPGSYYTNGHIKRITYWGSRLTDAELLTLTTSGPDALGFNSGWLNALQFTFEGDQPASWGSRYALINTFAATTLRYVSVEFDDPLNAAGCLTFGRLFAANGFQPTTNAAYGLKSGIVEFSSVLETLSGQKYFNTKPTPRSETFELEFLSQGEADQIHELQAQVGIVDEVLYVPDSGDAAYTQRFGFLGRLRELDVIDHPFYLNHVAPLIIEEKL